MCLCAKPSPPRGPKPPKQARLPQPSNCRTGGSSPGKTSGLMGASCAALLNAIKLSAGIDDRVNLISPMVLAPIQHLKIEHLGNSNPRLHTDEVLIALSISAVTNPTAELAMGGAGLSSRQPGAFVRHSLLSR